MYNVSKQGYVHYIYNQLQSTILYKINIDANSVKLLNSMYY